MLSSLTHANKFVNAINKSQKKISFFFGNDDGDDYSMNFMAH